MVRLTTRQRLRAALRPLAPVRRLLASLLLRLAGRPGEPPLPPDYLAPEKLKRELSPRAMREKADQYFVGIEDPADLLKKPFSRIEDTPGLLFNLSVLLRGLDLQPGMTVLDFAAGSAWAARIFEMLDCHAVAIDVSYAALRLGARATGNTNILFTSFDGERLPLADEKVDRIFCFDAFHHVPEQAAVLREMFRVLKPGGIAAFGEPGPHHSRSAQSQSEMRTFKVLEDDLHLDEIWEEAQKAGFTNLRVSLFNATPPSVSLEEFENFLGGGVTCVDYIDQTRHFLSNVRDFFLFKPGEVVHDSRRPTGLRADITVKLAPREGEERVPFSYEIRNVGESTWLPSTHPVGGVSLACHLFTDDGTLINLDFHWQHTHTTDIAPGETTKGEGLLPPLDGGRYVLEFDMVSNHVIWFGQTGSRTVSIPLTLP